jgi:hypothetical protein
LGIHNSEDPDVLIMARLEIGEVLLTAGIGGIEV